MFLVSGAAGLAYEVIWTRALSLVFGVTAFAAASVLATYMGGLALGSFAFGRRVDRQRNPLLTYALLEAGIGAYALCVPALIAALREPFAWVHALDLSYPVFSFARALLAMLVLLVPTVLMGGTFPVLVRFFVRTRREVELGTATLYAVNTLGAVAGCLLAGFFLIERFGLTLATQLTAGVNFAAAAIAAAVALTAPASAGLTEPPDRAGELAGRAAVSRAARAAVLVGIGLSGFAALGYEVLWTRALLRFLYNSTYAFTTMLATFLVGIALGSAGFGLLRNRIQQPVLVFAGCQLAIGLGFLGSAFAFDWLAEVAGADARSGSIRSFGDSLALMFGRSAAILLPASLFLGFALPLATSICVAGVTTLGSVVGRVYALNTFGAILGSLVTAFVLIPALGMHGSLRVLVALNLACAAAVLLAGSEGRTSLRAAAALACGVALVAPAAIPADLFRRTFVPEDARLVYYREGATDTVGVVDNLSGRIIVYDDRRGTAGTWTFRWNFFFGHLPLLLHPGEPKRVLNICFGVGNSLAAVAAHGSVERIDSVELSPHVVEAADFFWTNDAVLADPRVRTIIDDGRNYVVVSRETYDVIELEPPEIFTAGVINLFTRDFYRDAAERLAPDGILIQWLPVGEAPIDDERRLFRAFTDVFPHASAWRQLEDGTILLVGSREPLRIDYQRLRARLRAPELRRQLELVELKDADHLLSFFTLDAPALAEFVRDVEPVTDDRTVLDFSMPRYVGSGFGLGSLNAVVWDGSRSPLAVFNERMRFYFEKRRSVLPYLHNLAGEDPRAIEARIDGYAKQLPFPTGARYVPEASWRRATPRGRRRSVRRRLAPLRARLVQSPHARALERP